jgi:hypothetical protein
MNNNSTAFGLPNKLISLFKKIISDSQTTKENAINKTIESLNHKEVLDSNNKSQFPKVCSEKDNSTRAFSNKPMIHSNNINQFKNFMRKPRKPDWIIRVLSPTRVSRTKSIANKRTSSLSNKNVIFERNENKLKLKGKSNKRIELPPLNSKNTKKVGNFDILKNVNQKKEILENSNTQEIMKLTTCFRDKYKTISVLGKGSNSSVYLCKNRRTKELYAVKVIKRKKLQQKSNFRNFKVSFCLKYFFLKI